MSESPRPDLQMPYVLAMLICDTIVNDPKTGKSYLLGTFSAVAAPKFPARIPQMAVWFSLTDGRGPLPVKIRLVGDDPAETVYFEASQELDFVDPRSVADGAIQLSGLELPRPGTYYLQLLAHGVPIHERRFVAFDVTEVQP